MKPLLCVCFLFSLLLTGTAQPRLNRPHPFYNRQQQQTNNNNNFLTLALLFGLDLSDILALQATSARQPGLGNLGLGNLGLGLGNFGQPLAYPGDRRRVTQDINTLSALGILDGPDVPDGPARGQGRRRGKKRAGAKGGAGAAARGEAQEGARAKKPSRRGPRRKAKSAAKK